MRTFKISFALVVLLAASTYTSFAQIDTDSASITNKISDEPVPVAVSYPTTSQVKNTVINNYYNAQPKATKFKKIFANGLTGISDVAWRFNAKYDVANDYRPAKLSYLRDNADQFDNVLIKHLTDLNSQYGWGFAKVDADTVRWILNNSQEVYETFGSGEYTIFAVNSIGRITPMTRVSDGAEKLIKFHNVAYINCTSGGITMPTEKVGSYPVRNKNNRDAEVWSLLRTMMGADSARDLRYDRHFARMHGIDIVVAPDGSWVFIPYDDSPSFGDILEVVLVLALIAFIVWLLWLLIFGNRRSVNESTVIISIINSTTVVLVDDEDEPTNTGPTAKPADSESANESASPGTDSPAADTTASEVKND